MESLKEKLTKLFEENSIEERSSTGTTGEHIIYAPYSEMIDEIVRIVENPASFKEASEPLMKWLSENRNPHSLAIVTYEKSDIMDGIKSYSTDKYILD